MKIKSLETENTYILPLDALVNIVVTSNYKEDLIQCLTNLCMAKKKNKALLLSDKNEIVHDLDCNFIYIPYADSIETNFQFKAKSVFNTELVELIQNNPDWFLSIEKIRMGCKDLLADKGFYEFQKIINRGVDNYAQIEMNDFNIGAILQMLQVNVQEVSSEDKYKMVYNLMLYLNQDKTNLVYLDFPVTSSVFSWIEKVKTPNTYFFIDNEGIENFNFETREKINFIKLSKCDFKEEFDIRLEDISRLSYIFHSFIQKNIDQQSQKNIDLYHLFSDENTTFLLKTNDAYIQNNV